jgi:hypothetical protein
MYRTIDCNFWDDPKIRRLGNPMTAYVLIYLFGNRHTHVSGIYYLARPTMLHETQLSPRALDLALRDLISREFISIDEERNIVWVHKMLRRQCKKGICDQHIKAVVKQLDTLDDSPLVSVFLSHYQDLAIPYTMPHAGGIVSSGDTPSPSGDGDVYVYGDGDVCVPHPDAPASSTNNSKASQLAKINLAELQDKFRDLDVPAEFEKWQDWMSAKGKSFKDYGAAFRNWLRNAVKFHGDQTPTQPGKDPYAIYRDGEL